MPSPAPSKIQPTSSKSINRNTNNSKPANGKCCKEKSEKPPYSYVALISMAIQNSEMQRATLSEIYK